MSLVLAVVGLSITGFGVLWLREPGIIGRVPWWPDNELVEYATRVTGYIVGGALVLFGLAILIFTTFL